MAAVTCARKVTVIMSAQVATRDQISGLNMVVVMDRKLEDDDPER